MRSHGAAKLRHTYTLVWRSSATFICGGYATPARLFTSAHIYTSTVHGSRSGPATASTNYFFFSSFPFSANAIKYISLRFSDFSLSTDAIGEYFRLKTSRCIGISGYETLCISSKLF